MGGQKVRTGRVVRLFWTNYLLNLLKRKSTLKVNVRFQTAGADWGGFCWRPTSLACDNSIWFSLFFPDGGSLGHLLYCTHSINYYNMQARYGIICTFMTHNICHYSEYATTIMCMCVAVMIIEVVCGVIAIRSFYYYCPIILPSLNCISIHYFSENVIKVLVTTSLIILITGKKHVSLNYCLISKPLSRFS